jgi:hypothetical protein
MSTIYHAATPRAIEGAVRSARLRRAYTVTTLVAPPVWTVGPFVVMLLAIAVGPLAAPQRGQNAKSGSHAKPHAAHGLGSRRPHRGQNAKPGAASVSQPGQVIISEILSLLPQARASLPLQ